MFIARCRNKINVVPLSCYVLPGGNFSTEIFRLSISKLVFYTAIASKNTYVLEAGDECFCESLTWKNTVDGAYGAHIVIIPGSNSCMREKAMPISLK